MLQELFQSCCLVQPGEVKTLLAGTGGRYDLPEAGNGLTPAGPSFMAAPVIEPAAQNGDAGQVSCNRVQLPQAHQKTNGASITPAAGAPVPGEGHAVMPLSTDQLEAPSSAQTLPKSAGKALESAPSKLASAIVASMGIRGEMKDRGSADRPMIPITAHPPGPATSSPTPLHQEEAAPALEHQAAKRQPVLTREAAIERLEGLLRRLTAEHDPEGFFRERVSTDLKGCENYYDRIKNPMWVSLICSKLREGKYHTLNQLQADVELVCSNAITFNLKPSKVYKNAQALGKASKKQFQVERGMLLEAIGVLHPGGPEAAKKDEAEEERLCKAAPPPKKPAKPSKPPSKPPKKPPAISSLTGGSGNYASLVSSPSSSNVAALLDAQRSLPSLGEADDLLVDVREHDLDGFSSFSDSEDERPGGRFAERGGAPTLAQPWKKEPLLTSQAGLQAAAASSSQPNAWRAKRRCTEWRVRWLELRLRELKHQQARYEQLLESVRGGSAVGLDDSANVQAVGLVPSPPSHPEGPNPFLQPINGKALEAQDFKTPEARQALPVGTVQASNVWSGGGEEPPRKKQRRQRQAVRELGGEPLLEHPFFAAQAGFRKNKQVVKEAEDADLSDEDVNYPARAYAAAELLERHCLGLRELLCQPEAEGRPPGKPPLKGGGRARASSMRGRNSHSKSAARYRSRQESLGSGFLVHGLPSQQLDLGKPVKDILIPKFREHSSEELQARAELLAAYEVRKAKRKEREAVQASSEAGDAAMKEPDHDVESSSSEDTSDEAYYRTHTLLEQQERDKYEGEATKKKRHNKSKTHNNSTDVTALAHQQSTAATSTPLTGLLKLPSLKTHVSEAAEAAEVQQGSPLSETGSPSGACGKDQKRGRPPGSSSRGRGRARGRGRPPSSGRAAALSGRPARPAGPGRGHKSHKVSEPELPASLGQKGGPAAALPANPTTGDMQAGNPAVASDTAEAGPAAGKAEARPLSTEKAGAEANEAANVQKPADGRTSSPDASMGPGPKTA